MIDESQALDCAACLTRCAARLSIAVVLLALIVLCGDTFDAKTPLVCSFSYNSSAR